MSKEMQDVKGGEAREEGILLGIFAPGQLNYEGDGRGVERRGCFAVRGPPSLRSSKLFSEAGNSAQAGIKAKTPDQMTGGGFSE